MISHPLANFSLLIRPSTDRVLSTPSSQLPFHPICSSSLPQLPSHPICSSFLPPSVPIPSVHPPFLSFHPIPSVHPSSLPQFPSPLFILPFSAPIPSHLFILPPSLSSCDLGPVLDDHHLRGCLPLHRHSPVGTLHPVLLPRLLLREAEEGCGGLHLLHQ